MRYIYSGITRISRIYISRDKVENDREIIFRLVNNAISLYKDKDTKEIESNANARQKQEVVARNAREKREINRETKKANA